MDFSIRSQFMEQTVISSYFNNPAVISVAIITGSLIVLAKLKPIVCHRIHKQLLRFSNLQSEMRKLCYHKNIILTTLKSAFRNTCVLPNHKILSYWPVTSELILIQNATLYPSGQ